MTPETAISIACIAWYASWAIAARWANKTQKHPGSLRELPYFILEITGLSILMFYPLAVPWTNGGSAPFYAAPIPHFWLQRLWQLPVNAEWAFFWFAIAGFAFCWWARIHLGKLWSGFITRKEGHRVVQSGPYAIVRHPIYTGVLAAAIAATAIRGTPLALLSLALLLIAYQFKTRLEEKFLSEELGADTYADYRRRVPRLLPFAPR